MVKLISLLLTFCFVFYVVLLCVFTFLVLCCDVRYEYDFRIETMFGSSVPPVVCRKVHVLFTFFMFVLVQWCPTHIVLCFCCVYLRLVYRTLCCQFLWIVHCLIAPSVFSNVYLFPFTIIFISDTLTIVIENFCYNVSYFNSVPSSQLSSFSCTVKNLFIIQN